MTTTTIRPEIASMEPTALLRSDPDDGMHPYLWYRAADDTLGIDIQHQAWSKVSADVFDGHVRRWWLPSNVDAARLTERIHAGELEPLLARLRAGYRRWRTGGIEIGLYGDDGAYAQQEIHDWCRTLDTLPEPDNVWHAADWLYGLDSDVLGVTAEMTDEEVDALALDIERTTEREHQVMLRDTGPYLRDRRDDLRSGD